MIKLNNFRGIYIFFWVKIVVGWSKNLCNLIIVVGFYFCANLTVKSSLNYWDQSITVGSSQDFKYDHLNISPIYPDKSLIFPDISPIFYRKIKLTRLFTTYLIFS